MIPRHPRPHLVPALAGLLGMAAGVAAQDNPWQLAVTRRPADQRIVIDGRLDEPAWGQAARLPPLTQVDPIEGAAPTHPTIVRICIDRDYFYLALDCRDDPQHVRNRLMDRDAELSPDDRVEFWIDTFDDRRFAYWFQIGAGGSKGDALIGGGGFNKSWDGIWRGRARVTSRGWQAEIAIPFKTIAFGDGTETWGFNIRRLRKYVEEEDRWARPLLAYQFFSIANGGVLTGLRGMRHGIGLDVVPYLKVAANRDRRVRKHTSATSDAGLDLNYRLTPALNLRLTYNTDFAETEVDTRRTNLTRFPLFFPEKRDFFLEDAGLFNFGISGGSPSMIPFFSRRLGRDDNGAAIPIIAGAKLTGRADDWNLGLLDVVQDEHVDAADKVSDRRSLGVLRVSRNVGRESYVGMIATSGRPIDPGDAYTAGVDFKLQDSSAFGEGHSFDLSGWWVASRVSGPGGEDAAYGLRTSYRSKDWDVTLTEDHVEAEFSPELGFVRRTGVRDHQLSVERTWYLNGSFIRRWQSRVQPRLTTLQDGDLDSWNVFVRPVEVTFHSDDRLEYDLRREFWRLPSGFAIHDGITIPAGDYVYTTHSVELSTSRKRWLYVNADLRWGGFYNGNLTSVELDPTFILGPHLRIGGGYEQNHVSLDQGSFTTHTYSGRVDFSFTPLLSWRNLVQYDSDSKNLSAQTRVRWILDPGKELFLVGLYSWEKADHTSPFLPTTQDTALKVLYTLRF